MLEPVALHRSMSLPELAGIWHRGAVVGGGNLFNPIDSRKLVFFADEIDDRLVRQGEYVDRQVRYALKDHEVAKDLELATKSLEAIADLIVIELDRDGIRYDHDLVPLLQIGLDKRHFRSAVFRCPRSRRHRPKYSVLFRLYSSHYSALATASAKYEAEYALWLSEAQERIAKMPVSSAIITTHPVMGGLVFATEFDGSGHGGPEYGFQPGQIMLTDIAEVRFIKAGREVDRFRSPELEPKLRLLDSLA